MARYNIISGLIERFPFFVLVIHVNEEGGPLLIGLMMTMTMIITAITTATARKKL